MAAKSIIVDGQGTGNKGCVTSIGQFVTAPYSYDLTEFKELAVDVTAYNFYEPQPNKQFVITGIVAKAARSVSNTVDADVVVYESTSAISLTESRVLFRVAMVAGEQVVLMPLNILVNEGVWINSSTTDGSIHMTIMGYYIPKLT